MTDKKPSLPPPPRLDVVKINTQEIVRSIPLSSANERYVERVMRGLLINFDSENYFLREVLR